MEIRAKKYLSSYEFYKWVPNIKEQLLYQYDEQVVLDFTGVERIEPLVIPNLLCLGELLKSITKESPVLKLAESLTGGYLKKYLNDIGFLEYAMRYDLYTFENSPYGGLEGKKMDPKNLTMIFPCNGIESGDDFEKLRKDYYRRIALGISPFAQAYLKHFNINEQERDERLFSENIIEDFIYELAINSAEHGESFSFTTVQANYRTGRVYIATSDIGKGFRNSISSNIKKGKLKFNILDREPIDELEGIMVGLYARENSRIYGLFNVIRKILEFDGIVRIHSNDVQVILTKKWEKIFIERKLPHEKKLEPFNIRRNLVFGGVHIEVDLPLSTK